MIIDSSRNLRVSPPTRSHQLLKTTAKESKFQNSITSSSPTCLHSPHLQTPILECFELALLLEQEKEKEKERKKIPETLPASQKRWTVASERTSGARPGPRRPASPVSGLAPRRPPPRTGGFRRAASAPAGARPPRGGTRRRARNRRGIWWKKGGEAASSAPPFFFSGTEERSRAAAVREDSVCSVGVLGGGAT